MKKYIFLLFLLTPIIAFAQKQNGHVKTLGRPNKPGSSLSGVSVRVQTVHESLLSDKNGNFSFFINKAFAKDSSYRISSVRKEGYTLMDADFLNKPHAISASIPVEIVMVSQKELEKERAQIEQNAYARASMNYKKRVEELNARLEHQKITAESYRVQLAKLEEEFDRFEVLVTQLAERYARTDYDNLSDIDRQINQHIEAGEMFEAQRLILSVMNPETVVDENRKSKEELTKRRLAEERIVQINNQFEADILAKQASDAKHLYDLYTIAISRFQNDSAGFFLLQRAKLDPQNLDWQMDAGFFFEDFLNDYEAAGTIYDHALSMARSVYGEISFEVSTCLNSLGSLYYHTDRYPEAVEAITEAIRIRNLAIPQEPEALARLYLNLGILRYDLSDYDACRKEYDTALSLAMQQSDPNDDLLADIYCELSALINTLEGPAESMNYLNKALAISQGETQRLKIQSTIALRFMQMGQYHDSLESFQSSLEKTKQIYGINHLKTASVIDNMAQLYEHFGDPQKELELHLQALDIRKNILGDVSEEVSVSLNNIGTCYLWFGEFDKALDCYLESVSILDKLKGPDVLTFDKAQTYFNIAGLYNDMNNGEEAARYNDMALETCLKTVGDSNYLVARCYNLRGVIASEYAEDTELALESYRKALSIMEQVSAIPSLVYEIQSNIAVTYLKSGNYDEGMKYMETAVETLKRTDGENTQSLLKAEGNIGSFYVKLGDHKAAVDHYEKARQLAKTLYDDENNYRFGELSAVLAFEYGHLGQWRNATIDCLNAIEWISTEYGINSNAYTSYCLSAYRFCHNWMKEENSSEALSCLQRLMSDKLFTFNVVAGQGFPAEEKGLSGKYYLMAFDNWSYTDDLSFLDVMTSLRESGKDITLERNGTFIRVHFDGTIGAQFILEYVAPHEKESLLKSYTKWQSEN